MASSYGERFMRVVSKLAVLVCLILLAVVAMPTGAFAADDEQLAVKVGYYENEVFQEGAAEGAVKSGYAYEYYRKLSEYTGWRYEYVYGDYADLYQKLLNGEVDLLAGLAWKEDRVGLIGYPDSAMGNESYNLVKHTSDTDIVADPSSLSQKKIGVLDSAMLDVLRNYLDEHKVEAEVVPFTSYDELLAAFDEHTVDVLAIEGDSGYIREDAEVVTLFGSADYFLCVNVKRPDLLEELNRAQAQLFIEEPNYISSLNSKYYSHTTSSRAYTTIEREWIDEHESMKVGYLNNYLPYSDTDEKGEVTGIVKDVVAGIVEDLGLQDIQVSYQGFASYDDMIVAVNAGEIDVAFPVGGGLYYSEENGIYQTNAVASASTELVYKGEYSDAVVDSFAVNEKNRMQYYYIKTNFPEAEITLYPSIDDCLEAVLAGKVGCTTLNGLRANDILKNRKYSNLSLKQLSYSDDRCFGVKIGNEGLLKLLNRGLSVVGEDYIMGVVSDYTDELYSYSVIDFLLDHIALMAAIILALAALIMAFLVRDSKRTRRLAADKEAARQELEDKNRELEESQAALADALVAAEHASRAKTTFLNNMSHDIRTPMNAIVGFTALAASHIDNKEQVLDYLGKISVSSQHLLSLINDVLDMSRIESGKVKIEEGDVHLPELIHDLRTIVQADITDRRQELFIDTQDVVNEDIVTDKLRLNQILLNILSNAIKFTPPEGTISFRVIQRPSSTEGIANFEFRIKDNGIGMSEEFQRTIFDAFTRERNTTVSGIQGTGLGMAITKNIVDMMGGTITLNSEEGKGTEFIVCLPCKISATKVRHEPPPELQGVRALVADDDTNTCLSVCSMLRQIGMRSDWTNYGKEAVVRAKDALDSGDEFGVYIIDLMMPDLNGVETVRRIRKVIGDSAPIIILTAYDWADVEDEARQAGVTAFCSKPLFLSELREVLSRPFADSHGERDEGEALDYAGKRVLLAEDNALNQQIAQAILEEVGLSVEIAGDGVDAVEMVRSNQAGHYDVILMDIQMPRMDGYEAARQIRALDDPQKACIPIIAVTANAFEEDRALAIESGMNDHLAKPYDVPVMMQTLAELLGP